MLIGSMPAACLGDPHVCPCFSGPKSHVGGVITKGSTSLLIGNKPAARVSDLTTCTPEPGAIALGEFTVLIGDLGGSPGGSTPGAGASTDDAVEESSDALAKAGPAPSATAQTAALVAAQNLAAAASGAALCEICSPMIRKQMAEAGQSPKSWEQPAELAERADPNQLDASCPVEHTVVRDQAAIGMVPDEPRDDCEVSDPPRFADDAEV
jgi:uncharacterized Zn-binding protein involved in type VI secretion